MGDAKMLSEMKPTIIVFAGPNGSGKSSITDYVDIIPPYINADDIKKTYQCSDLEAAQKADVWREKCIAGKNSFTFETVLSTDSKLILLRSAKENGYFIKGFFVLTANPKVNVLRVQSREKQGGHGVPEGKVVSRYYKSLDRIPQFVSVCDVCHIYDNSGEFAARIFKKSKNGTFCLWENEFWSEEKIAELVGIPYPLEK